MRINSINSVSFKGINISKKQKDSEHKPRRYDPSDDTSLVIKRWSNDIDFLVTEYDQYHPENIAKLHEKFLAEEQSSKGYSLNGVAKRFLKRKDAFIEQDKLLTKQLVYADKMKAVREQALFDIHRIDQLRVQEAKNPIATISARQGVDKIAGYTEEIGILEDEFISKVKQEKAGENPEIFGSILFFGPNGNGKTYITNALAEATNSNISKVRIPNTSESQINKTMKKIVSIAEKSEEKFKEDRTRTIIFIDEIDKMISAKSPVIEEFSDFIKTCSEKYHCSVFGATNNPMDIALDYDDPDIFPVKMSIDIPNKENAKAMFEFYLKDKKEGDIDLDKILSVMEQQETERNGRYTNGQIKQMTLDINNLQQKEKISQQDLEEEIINTAPNLSQEMVDKFQVDYDKLIGKKW